MAVIVRLASGTTAIIDGYYWTARDPTVAALLNAMLEAAGPSGADPDPDRTAAQRAIAVLGGEILRADDAPFEDGVIY
jgi:hypothetical protein